MMLTAARARVVSAVAFLALSATLSACSLGGGSGGQSNSPLVDTGQSQSGGAGTATPSSEVQSGRTTGRAGAATSTPTAGGPANVKVSPSDVTVGNLTITISVEQAHRMVPVGSSPGAPTAQPQGQGAAVAQDLVLGDQMLRVAKNLDAAQAAPPDPKDGQGDYIRHVKVQVKEKSTGQVVPYLDVTMDVLRDGRPVLYDVALVPMVPAGGKPDEVNYGNNVAFPGKGRYQLFVRMPGNPMLGGNNPPYAQFELTIE